MNGLDRKSLSVPGFRGGVVYRNEGGPGLDGWFYIVGSAEPRGPFLTEAAARADALKLYS